MTNTNTNTNAASNANASTVCECPKCGGTGYIQAFAHIQNGVCFWCEGTGRFDVHASRVEDPVASLARRYAAEGQRLSYADAEAVHTALFFIDAVTEKIPGGWLVSTRDPWVEEDHGPSFKVRDLRRIPHWVRCKRYRGEHRALMTSLDG